MNLLKLIILFIGIVFFNLNVSAQNIDTPPPEETFNIALRDNITFSDLLNELERGLDAIENSYPKEKEDIKIQLESKDSEFSEYYIRMNKADLWMYSKSWRFPIMLSYFCTEIEDLYDDYQEERVRYNAFKNEKITAIIAFQVFAQKLRKIDTRFLDEKDKKHLEAILAKSNRFEQLCDSSLVYIKNSGLVFYSLDTPLKILKSEAVSQRANMMDKIFLQPTAPLSEIFEGNSIIYSSLIDDLRFFYSLQKMLFVKLWIPLILVLLISLPLFCFAGKRIYKLIIKKFNFIDGAIKTKYFTFSIGVMILVLVMQIFRFNNNLDIILPLEMMRHFAAISLFVLAVSIRCSASEIHLLLRLYFPMMMYYLIIGTLWLGMVNYAMMVFISPLLNIVFIIWSIAVISHYRKRLPGLDVGLILVTTVTAVIGLCLSYFGYVYSSFVIIVFAFVIILGWQIAKAAAILINIYTTRHPNTQIINCILNTLLLPLMTLGVLFFGFNWTAEMFNVKQALVGVFDSDFISVTNVVAVSFRDILRVVLAAIALRFVLLLVRRIVEITYLDRAQFGLIPTLLTLLNYFAWAVFVIYSMLVFDINYKSMLVVLGGMSMGIGFGLKDVVDNFACGVGLLVGQQLRPGDEIECDGVRGVIKAIGFRLTVLESSDGAVVCFQNADILRKNFKNMTSNHGYERTDIIVGVAYGTEIEKARYAILEAVKSCRCVISHPSPEVLFWALDSSSINFSARVWVPVASKTSSSSIVRQKIYEMLNIHGIEIPFPQLDLHVISSQTRLDKSILETSSIQE